MLDGQGNCAGTRTNAALALADYLATDPTGSGDPDFLILGDLNSYRRETPITTLTGKGYTDLIEEHIGDDAYSFLFDGQLGYLDHALATQSLAAQVTGVTEWAINADEVAAVRLQRHRPGPWRSAGASSGSPTRGRCTSRIRCGRPTTTRSSSGSTSRRTH